MDLGSYQSHCGQAIEGVGINWSFAESEADADAVNSLPVRVCACLVSIGGMLVTALMLGIVSGEIWRPERCCAKGCTMCICLMFSEAGRMALVLLCVGYV